MKVKALAFGIAKDIIKASSIEIELPNQASVGDLRKHLYKVYPQFGEIRSLAIAVNQTYSSDELILTSKDEVVLIPPVSGG